jgi:hypothetical protein
MSSSASPRSPRTLRAGLVLLDPDTMALLRLITLQYNPDSLSRTLQIQGVGQEGGDHVEALRLKGPPAESIKLEAEIDAADQLEIPSKNPLATALGIYPQIAALESMVYPSSATVIANMVLATVGVMEIIPMQSPLTIFVWSRNRVLPVRITELSVTEEAFDPNLNPLRAKVSLGMRVLSAGDLGFTSPASFLHLAYHMQIEALARILPPGGLSALGLKGLP